jgi:hypothetical protein
MDRSSNHDWSTFRKYRSSFPHDRSSFPCARSTFLHDRSTFLHVRNFSTTGAHFCMPGVFFCMIDAHLTKPGAYFYITDAHFTVANVHFSLRCALTQIFASQFLMILVSHYNISPAPSILEKISATIQFFRERWNRSSLWKPFFQGIHEF